MHRAGLPELGDLGVVEAELDQDLARMLAERRRAAPQLAAAPAVREDRKGGEAFARGFACQQLLVAARSFSGGYAKVDGDIVLLEKLDPLFCTFFFDFRREHFGQYIAVRAPLRIRRKLFSVKTRHDL